MTPPVPPTLGLSGFFEARSIAIVGASDRPGSVGHDVLSNLLRKKFQGSIYPVNPRLSEISGLTCYPDLGAVPASVDLVAVAVPASGVADVIRQAGARGIAHAVVFASGFAETGAEGAALQEDLTAAAASSGITVLGPNCQGFMNIAAGMHVGFGPPYGLDYRSGPVAIVSQSGAFGNSLLMGMQAEGVGTRRYASTGNEAQTDALGLIDSMLDDPETRVIATYLEGLRRPELLRHVASRARRQGVPLVVWKVGRSVAGARAAASHTASLADDDRLLRAAFAQFGIIEATDIGDMADCVRALASGQRARGPRLGIITISGGAGVAMADRAADLGLPLADLQPHTLIELRNHLPAFASFANPLDVTAGATADAESFKRALLAMAADPGVDLLALSFAAVSGKAGDAIATAVTDLAARHDIPIAISWNAPREGNEAAFERIEAAGLPIFATPARTVRGLGAIWQANRRQPLAAGETRLHKTRPSRQLDEAQSKIHLAETGIVAPSERIALSADAAVAAAREIGFPVVMKLLSSHLAHKSDIGGVRLGLQTPDAVSDSFAAMRAIPASLDPPVPFEGVLLQEQIRGGIELILGARNDPRYGPLVMVGTGGVMAELFDDVALRLAPVDETEANAMISETRADRLIAGWRKAPPGDRAALARAIATLSQRIADPEALLEEIEINPVFLRPPGDGLIAGDCVAYLADSPAGEAGEAD